MAWSAETSSSPTSCIRTDIAEVINLNKWLEPTWRREMLWTTWYSCIRACMQGGILSDWYSTWNLRVKRLNQPFGNAEYMWNSFDWQKKKDGAISMIPCLDVVTCNFDDTVHRSDQPQQSPWSIMPSSIFKPAEERSPRASIYLTPILQVSNFVCCCFFISMRFLKNSKNHKITFFPYFCETIKLDSVNSVINAVDSVNNARQR